MILIKIQKKLKWGWKIWLKQRVDYIWLHHTRHHLVSPKFLLKFNIFLYCRIIRARKYWLFSAESNIFEALAGLFTAKFRLSSQYPWRVKNQILTTSQKSKSGFSKYLWVFGQAISGSSREVESYWIKSINQKKNCVFMIIQLYR